MSQQQQQSKLSNQVGTFSWDFGQLFLIETSGGNYIWSSPDYNGDNTMRKFKGGNKEFCIKCKIPYSRDKGIHFIGTYCGEFVLIDGE